LRRRAFFHRWSSHVQKYSTAARDATGVGRKGRGRLPACLPHILRLRARSWPCGVSLPASSGVPRPLAV